MFNNGNCVRVVGQALTEGINVEMDEAGRPKLPIGNLSFLPPDSLMKWAWIRHSARQNRKLIMCCKGQAQSAKDTYIIFLKFSDFNFGGSPYLQGLNLWPGTEAQGLYPFWSSLYDKSHLQNREQLWFLKEGAEIILVDQFGGILVLRYQNGELSLKPPTPKEVATFFRGKLSNPDISRRAHDWASHNLAHVMQCYPGS